MNRSSYRERYRDLLRMLRGERKRAGLTQAALAQRLAITQSVVSKCERGERRIDAIELLDFCEAIGVPPADILSRLRSRRGK
jgi:transcriptional regulator with XRE-family HTH domain